MRFFLCLAIFAFLAGCQSSVSEPAFTSLNRTALFESDSVSQFLHAANKAQADSSKKLFLKAVDVFRNGKNPFGAIELFLSSLSVYPTASTYYELGNAYLEKGKFNLALQSFQMAEGLGYDPLSQVLFKQACCYAELDSDQAYEYISYAVENGFVDRNKIFNSPHFAKFRDDAQLQSVYYDAMSGNGDPDEILWHGYLRSYKAARLPLALDSGYFRRMGEPRSISYDYENYIPEMRDGKFSRDVGSIYFYVARLTSGNAFTTLVYGCQSYENSGAPVSYILATFDSKGKLLGKQVIAGAQTYDEPYKEALIGADLTIQVKAYKNQWEKDTEKEGYEENRITGRELVSTQEFTINAQGRLVPTQPL